MKIREISIISHKLSVKLVKFVACTNKNFLQHFTADKNRNSSNLDKDVVWHTSKHYLIGVGKTAKLAFPLALIL